MASLINPHSAEWTVGYKEYNRTCIDSIVLSNHVDWKRIAIDSSCFGRVRVFEIDGLGGLESIVVGNSSFDYSSIDVDASKKRTDGVIRIVNCPKLDSIQIGDWSFSDYHSFELRNLPRLQSFVIGNCFCRHAPLFSLTGFAD